jgi:hypothetical protein
MKVKTKEETKEEKRLFDQPVWVKKGRYGIQRIYRFPNGYGASVIRIKATPSLSPFSSLFGEIEGEKGSYLTYTRNENEWEVAVIKFKGEKNTDWEVWHDAPFSDDDLIYLTEDKVEKILQRIKKLKPK